MGQKDWRGKHWEVWQETNQHFTSRPQFRRSTFLRNSRYHGESSQLSRMKNLRLIAQNVYENFRTIFQMQDDFLWAIIHCMVTIRSVFFQSCPFFRCVFVWQSRRHLWRPQKLTKKSRLLLLFHTQPDNLIYLSRAALIAQLVKVQFRRPRPFWLGFEPDGRNEFLPSCPSVLFWVI